MVIERERQWGGVIEREKETDGGVIEREKETEGWCIRDGEREREKVMVIEREKETEGW